MYQQSNYSVIRDSLKQKFYISKTIAHASDLYGKYELRRAGRMPTGKPCAWLVTPYDESQDVIQIKPSPLDDLIWLDDHTIGVNPRNLYRVSETKPYNPTARTRAIWTFSDVFVPNFQHYRVNELEVTASKWDFLSETKLSRHVRGIECYEVYAGKKIRFLGLKVTLDRAEEVLGKAETVKSSINAIKWFIQISHDSLMVYFVFARSVKPGQVIRLQKLFPFAQVGPSDDIPFPLPLSSSCLTITNKIEKDVVSFVQWFNDDEQNTALPNEVFDHLQRYLNTKKEQNKEESSIGNRVLLYIVSQLPEKAEVNKHLKSVATSTCDDIQGNSRLKGQWWRVLYGFLTGSGDCPAIKALENDLNSAINQMARILWASSLPLEEAESIIQCYLKEIPNPKSSRLIDPSKEYALHKTIKRLVARVYDGNGGQADSEQSTDKLIEVVRTWRSKGLFFEDKSTWKLTYGAFTIQNVEFTEQELHNIQAYLLPLLSGRDTKERDPQSVAAKLANDVIRLVAAKHREGRAIARSYFQDYIHKETGINCKSKSKISRLLKALIELGFIKILKPGSKRAGATYYGLAGRMCEVLGQEEIPEEIPEEISHIEDNDELLEAMITPIDEVECEPQPVCRTKRIRLTSDPIFNALLLKEDELHVNEPPSPDILQFLREFDAACV